MTVEEDDDDDDDDDDARNYRINPSHHSHRGLAQIIISTTTMTMIKKRVTRKKEVNLNELNLRTLENLENHEKP